MFEVGGLYLIFRTLYKDEIEYLHLTLISKINVYLLRLNYFVKYKSLYSKYISGLEHNGKLKFRMRNNLRHINTMFKYCYT